LRGHRRHTGGARRAFPPSASRPPRPDCYAFRPWAQIGPTCAGRETACRGKPLPRVESLPFRSAGPGLKRRESATPPDQTAWGGLYGPTRADCRVDALQIESTVEAAASPHETIVRPRYPPRPQEARTGVGVAGARRGRLASSHGARHPGSVIRLPLLGRPACRPRPPVPLLRVRRLHRVLRVHQALGTADAKPARALVAGQRGERGRAARTPPRVRDRRDDGRRDGQLLAVRHGLLVRRVSANWIRAGAGHRA
jgi:hypothetical protein